MTGLPGIDEGAQRLHAAAHGQLPKKKTPAQRRSTPPPAEEPAPPYADYARFLHSHLNGGELLRRLQPGVYPGHMEPAPSLGSN
ncbi:hypothetical protein [Streptomyces sp. NPDC003943]